MPMLRPSVSAVPISDHQRMPRSVPRGKNSSPIAKTLGTNTTSVIQIESHSHCCGYMSLRSSPGGATVHSQG